MMVSRQRRHQTFFSETTPTKVVIQPGDPKAVRDFVALLDQERYAPTTIQVSRVELRRYAGWLRAHGRPPVERAGLKDFTAYRKALLQRPIGRRTVYSHLRAVLDYYRLRMLDSGREDDIELWQKIRELGRVTQSYEHRPGYKPLSPEIIRRVVDAARSSTLYKYGSSLVKSDDYPFIMTLLYTGARAQIYGLRVREIDFAHHEIRTPTKGNPLQTIPLHPTLAKVLRTHLRTRDYESEFVFRRGRDRGTFRGVRNNHVNAERICDRVQRVAGLKERLHPHRFRATLASEGRRLGLTLEEVRAILGHADPKTTLQSYLRADPEDLRRDFSVIDLIPAAGTFRTESAMRGLAPPGTQHGWDLVVRGLLGLTTRATRERECEADPSSVASRRSRAGRDDL